MSYLENHPLLESHDIDELQDILSKANGIDRVELVGKGKVIDVKANGLMLDGMYLGNFEYDGAETKYFSSDGADILQLIIISSGIGQAEYRNQTFEMSNKVGFMRDYRQAHVSTAGKIDGLGMQLPIERIKEHACRLLGEGAHKIVPNFEMNFNLSSPNGIHISNTLSYIADAMNTIDMESQNNIIIKSFSDLMLTQVLQLIPNSYSSLLAGNKNIYPLPRYLKRARDYIHVHAASPITLEKLVEHSGCSYRTLQIAFKETYEMTPMEYVKYVRLSFAHEDLLKADEGSSVRDIALKWGFTHMGWFSKKYTEQFGVLPSQTLRMGV